jgi:hypothetical protein
MASRKQPGEDREQRAQAAIGQEPLLDPVE